MAQPPWKKLAAELQSEGIESRYLARVQARVTPEERLEHVIAHLVQNALDATVDSGRVTVRLFRDRAHAVVEVADTGVGMSPEFVRDKLFKPFATTKPAGMGIGVYESSQYLAGIGGQMAIESAPGTGTRVRVQLPAGDAAAASAATWKDVA